MRSAAVQKAGLAHVVQGPGCASLAACPRDRHDARARAHHKLKEPSVPIIDDVIEILTTTLQLDDSAANLSADSALLGAIPEFDSMAVVTVLTAIEERFDITVDDDEIDAETFETVGKLAEFVSAKVE
jgi:acyl carrier protein